MKIIDGVELQKTTNIQYEEFALAWDFGGNSSAISLQGDGAAFASSEHWITDTSDILSFDSDCDFVGAKFSVPNMNGILDADVGTGSDLYGRIRLSCSWVPQVPPRKLRNFDARRRRLICFDKDAESEKEISLFRMKEDFSLILLGGSYAGYVLNNPIEYIVGGPGGGRKAGAGDYEVFEIFYEIMSDNRLVDFGGDMGRLVEELRSRVLPRLGQVQGDVSRAVLVEAINDLSDFYQ